MKLINEQQTKRLIRQQIRKSVRSRLVVAFWGDGACEKLDLAGREDSVSIVCNLRMGGTNPNEVEEMLRLNIPVTHCDSLHAKVYLFDNAVIIGSSNASSNGLSFQDEEGHSWIEANVFSDDPKLIKSVESWMSKLTTRPITEDDIVSAKEQWRRRRQAIRHRAQGKKSLLDVLRESPTAFDDQEIYACFYSQTMDEEGEAGMQAAVDEYGPETDGFQDWPELPKPATLISFKVRNNGDLTNDGCYRRYENPYEHVLKNSILQLMWKENDRPDLKVTQAELAAWKPILAAVQDSDLWKAPGGFAAVKLSEIANRFQS